MPDLIASYWTIAGNVDLTGSNLENAFSPHDFQLRVETARQVGYKGIGLLYSDIQFLRTYLSYSDIKSILKENFISYLELEFLTDWFVTDARRAISDKTRDGLLEAASALGATHIKVA